MKIFSAPVPAKPPDRPTAWACLMANAMVLPGLGSWLMGRAVGLIQMSLALAGFGLTAIWAVWFVRTWVALKQLPLDPGPHLGKALLGLLVFAIAWTWALGSSIAILRKAA